MRCPVCLDDIPGSEYESLSDHLLQMEKTSDSEHIMWMNRYVGRKKIAQGDLAQKLSNLYDSGEDLKSWIISRLVERIYGDPPHPFIVRFQRPDKKSMIGYVLEHHHFLMQWVKSCSAVIAKTDEEDVQIYEIDNIISEFRGNPPDMLSHHELLLRLGDSLGIKRSEVYDTRPLPATEDAIVWWDWIARECHWVEIMAAMHTLELTANRDIRNFGATATYFDPSILEDVKYSNELRTFLNEGYNADTQHSMKALNLIAKYCDSKELERNVKSVTLKTIVLLDNYLMARLERGEAYGD